MRRALSKADTKRQFPELKYSAETKSCAHYRSAFLWQESPVNKNARVREISNLNVLYTRKAGQAEPPKRP